MTDQPDNSPGTMKATTRLPNQPNRPWRRRLLPLFSPNRGNGHESVRAGVTCGVLGLLLMFPLFSGCQRSTPAGENAPPAANAATTSPPNEGDESTDADIVVRSADAGNDEASLSGPPAEQQETPREEVPANTAKTVAGEEKTDSTSQSSASADTNATPASMKVRPRTNTRAGGLLDLTFDDFEFQIDKDADFDRSMLSDKVEEFDGKEILIRGFILDSSVFQLKNIKQFVLVRDNQQCCFGPGAYLYHNMQVEMVEGETANFSIRPVTVQGTFRIKPWIGPDGKCYSVYHVTAKSVE